MEASSRKRGGKTVKRTILTAILLSYGVVILALFLPVGQEQAAAAQPEDTPLISAQDKTLPIVPTSSAGDSEMRLTVWTDDGPQETSGAAYLPGVLAGEMPANFCDEALKAQAVAARTYILYKQEHGCAAHPEADVCNVASCCKAWLSEAEMQERWGEDYLRNLDKICRAVYETDGQYLSYAGEPIQAVFHSSSAGKTESSANLWQALPYLVSVDSPETQEDVPNYETEVEVSASALRDAVLQVHPAADFSGAPEAWLGGVYYNETGRVTYASLGGAVLSGAELRDMFDLRSTCFSLTYTETGFLFRVTGYGHGVGMSQYGANVLARKGASYQEILTHYYPGTELTALPA